MAFSFKMPDIGEGVVQGEIVKWHVAVGQPVAEDQLLVEVLTDKATVEITSPRSGTIGAINFAAGQVAKVGDVIVTIEDGSGGAPAARVASAPLHERARPGTTEPRSPWGAEEAAPGAGGPSAAVTAGAATAAQPNAPPPPGAGAPRAAPSVRRYAREKGVDLLQVRGSGPGGRIGQQDVDSFIAGTQQPAAAAAPAAVAPAPAGARAPAAAGAAAPSAGTAPVTPSMTAAEAKAMEERVPLTGVRKVIAAQMVKAKFTAPHFTYVESIDVTDLVTVRERTKGLAASRGIKLTYLPFIIKALVAAFRAYPMVNGTMEEETQHFVMKRYYHIGIATAAPVGLVVPVIKNCERKSILQIAQEIEDLAARATDNKLKREEMQGGTFTITSLGSRAGLLATPILNHPEVAIMGVHRMEDTPVVRAGQVVIRKMMNLSISLDHRVIDGVIGANFIHEVKRYLEDPNLLFMEMV